MNKELESIESILYEALKIMDSGEREAYLEANCGANTQLRAEIDSLLLAYEDEKGLLKTPSDLIEEPFNTVTEGPGTVIGQYKLLEQIGEGGMAIVYMAEQKSPLHRKVALKIIKLGMDIKSVIARFEVERQALAMMEHPNIAKVLDAGATETGRPYFVMELVKGVSITEYCDKNKLSTKDRLDLFISVCNAVQHAHQKGIIHRDIKPSNVMVTLRDGKPMPKVIDFGIAKATSQRLIEKTVFTRYAQMIGTPAYMSPEQAEFSEFDIDTRTDIYSLGVLLYELLTGTTPLDEVKLREAGYLEIQRIIREEEPVKPSTRLTTLGEQLTGVAEHRQTEPALLKKLVRGDLDWIVMKSLEKDRTRRYETVAGLADDIVRHLSSEPVLAVAPSALYRFGKLVRRNRVTVTAGVLIFIVLIAGIAATLIGFIHARIQSNLAQENFQQARDAVDEIMQVSRWRVTGAATAEEAQLQLAILTKGQAFYSRFLQHNPDDQQMKEEWGRSYQLLGETHMRLGNYGQAEHAYRKAIEVFEGLTKEFPDDGRLWNEVSISQSGLSFALFAQGRKREADDALVSCLKNWRPGTRVHRFGTPTSLGPHYNTPYLDGTPKQRADGLEMFFGSNRYGGYGHVDIWTATRASTDDEWSDPVNLGEPINAIFYDGTPTISSDGLEMIFPSVREGVLGSCDLWVTKRRNPSEPWSQPVNLGEVVNTSVWEGAPCLSADGLSLFFESSRSGGEGYDDLWVTTRPSRSEPWSKPVSLGPSVNSPHAESSPCISPDGLTLFFGSARPCGFGDIDIWMAERTTINAPWSEATNLGPGVNTLFLESHPSISPDGSVLYIGVSGRPGSDGKPDYKPAKDGLGTWDAYRVPILKLDGEGRSREEDTGE